MDTRDDGGWAFPRPSVQGARSYEDNEPAEPGMTLRDYFAAAAMSSIIESDHLMTDETETLGEYQRRAAEVAYGYADAMLVARKK